MTARRAAAAAVLAAVGGCAGALFTAPPGSTIALIPNPSFVPANGGVSVITAVVTEPAGTPVSDGTELQCFTDLGSIDRQVKTKTGVARANFVSDSRSGVAHISCQSGGTAPIIAASPGASPAPVTGGTSGTNSGTTQVTVGNALVKSVLIFAEPSRIVAGSNSTDVIANVVDANGNPVANVGVIFSVVADPATEFFPSPGPFFTNNNGQAIATLRTRRTTAGNAQVKASAAGPNGFVDSNTLTIPIL